MSSVRVVRLVTRLNVGGPTRQIASLMARLDPAHFSQTLVTGQAGPAEGEGMIDVPGTHLRLPSLERPIRPLHDWRAFRDLVRLLRTLRPDVVHTHQAKAGWIGRLAAARAGVPVIVHTYHGHTFRGYFSAPGSWVLRRLERLAARKSSALIALAESQKDDIGRVLGAAARERTHVIPPGIELPPAPRDRGARDATSTLVLFPARLEAVKDPMLALDVARVLPASFHLVIAGDGSLRGPVEERIAADPALAGRVTLRPMTADRGALFDGAAVTLLTSREEGTPLALIESQAFGVPVVAPDVGAVASVVGPDGGVVTARNARALADAVVAAADRAPAGASMHAWVRDRFDAGRMVASVASLYAALLGGINDP